MSATVFRLAVAALRPGDRFLFDGPDGELFGPFTFSHSWTVNTVTRVCVMEDRNQRHIYPERGVEVVGFRPVSISQEWKPLISDFGRYLYRY